jgi:tetratricopeptide (TPR) repeat protein
VRAIWRRRSAALAVMVQLWLAAGAALGSEVTRADPLRVPTGAPPEPEATAGLPAAERLTSAADFMRERGYDELPILAWALLDAARTQDKLELASRAAELAPGSPGVRFEAARLLGDPKELAAAVLDLCTSLPGALFALAFAGVVTFGGVLALALGLSAVAAVRGLPLHGHAFGHALGGKEPASWPGVLLCLALLAALPLFGVGPVALAACFGAFGALRLKRLEAFTVAVSLALAGVALGPGLDRLAPVLAAVGRDSAVVSAWRIDRGQALPGDLAQVQAASARSPDDGLFRLALGQLELRRGELARAEQWVAPVAAATEPAVEAAAQNLRGITHLARGDLAQAIPAFERARTAQESAAVVFNLSQSYGRALRLKDQEAAFATARSLDAELVTRFMTKEGANVHEYLAEPELPLALYLARALAPSAESRALAGELRERALGALPHGEIWLLLPAAGLAALVLRRSKVARCNRCDRAICARCSREGMSAGTCMRCIRLFIRREHTDPRLRKLQLDRDRNRQRRTAVAQAAAGLAAPGTVDLHDGRLGRGALLLFAIGAGFAALEAPGLVPVPWDLGSFGFALPTACALALLVPSYALGLTQAAKKLGTLRKRSLE